MKTLNVKSEKEAEAKVIELTKNGVRYLHREYRENSMKKIAE